MVAEREEDDVRLAAKANLIQCLQATTFQPPLRSISKLQN